VDGDQDAGEAEQDGDAEGGARAANGDSGRDGCRDESQAADGAEDAGVADQAVLGEVLEYGCASRPIAYREAIDLVGEDPGGDALKHLPGAVEDDEGHERDSADPRRSSIDAAQEAVHDDRHEWDEEQRPNVDHDH
jgi:hypothetical protein